MTANSLVITNSELRCFQSCRRRWYLSYGLGFAPDPASEPVTGVMHLGSSIHLALEAWYGYGIDPLKALDWSYSQDLLISPGDEEALEKELQLAKVMTEGYLDWAAAEGIDAGLSIIGIEVTVEHPLEIDGHQVALRGKLDQLARRESDGALFARDLKTVGGLGKAQQLRFSSQLKFYALIQALEARRTGSGDLIAGGEYLLIARSKRTSRASPPFFERVEVPLNRYELNAQWQMTMAIIKEIIEARRRLSEGADHHSVVYPHFGDWCAWQCSFSAECSFMDDGSRWQDALLGNFIRRDALSYYSHDKISSLRTALT